MPSKILKRKERVRTAEARLPEYYVLLCARRYAAVVAELAAASTDDERRQANICLSYIFDSGMIEFKTEIERRERSLPEGLRRAFVVEHGSIVERSICREESEILRFFCAVPAFTSIDNLSAVEMENLAHMFEGARKARVELPSAQ